jgi:hypothetical protein
MQVYERRNVSVQRDLDLIRHLLLTIEQYPELNGTRWFQFTPADLGIADRGTEEVGYHLTLLVEAGFVLGQSQGYEIPAIARLTWEGHEFLDNIRDQTIWNATKKRFEGLVSVGLKVVAAVAEAEVKKRLGLS